MINLEVQLSEAVEFVSKVRCRGSSYYVLIPRNIVERIKLSDGDDVSVILSKIKIYPVGGEEDGT